MAITSVNEMYPGLSVSDKIDTNQIYIRNGSASRRFQVLFSTGDTPAVRPLMALAHGSIPQLWQVYPGYEYWFVASRNVSFGNGPLELFVEVDYEYIENPLAQTPEVTYQFEKSTEAIDKDITDQSILNSSNEPFDPPITKDYADLVIRVVKNETTYDPLVTQQFIDAVNSVPWAPTVIGQIFPAGTVKCSMINALPQRYGAVTYFQRTYEFRIRDDRTADGALIGWKRRILDQGLRKKTATGVDSITGDDKKPITTPVPLNGYGQPLTFDANGDATNLPQPTEKIDVGVNSVFLLYEVDKKKDLNELGL